MSFPKRRAKQKAFDKEYMRQARVRSHDSVAEKMTGGNTYTPLDIEMLEAEKLRYWKRRKL